MDTIVAARVMMGLSLAFHIVFAAAGVALPLFMVIAETIGLVRKDELHIILARRWAQGATILFAVGAVSGTALSFELGLLWPNFMHWSGSIIGMPFALEGFAFFGEAIFLGIYLYGWRRVRPAFHIAAGFLVALYGALSAIFVVSANGWMNTPAGFILKDGHPQSISPIDAMLNPSAAPEAVHMLIAAYSSIAILIGGIHAAILLFTKNDRQFHGKALRLSVLIAACASLLQIFAGDWAARRVAQFQPMKLAALEGQFKTERRAPLRIGGIPDPSTRRTSFDIEIPGGLSFLAFGDFNAEVKGLDSIVRADWPPEPAVHVFFQVMVMSGFTLAAQAIWTLILFLRGRDFSEQRHYLLMTALCSPLGLIALECGWMVTELGRQPWIIYGIMRVSSAVTPAPGIGLEMLTIFAVYLCLSAIVLWLIFRTISATSLAEERAKLKGLPHVS
jgi:cytochrome d ubiquinol oxidase subunit I